VSHILYVMSCHVMSCHVMSCPVISCHVISYHVKSCPQQLNSTYIEHIIIVIDVTMFMLMCSCKDGSWYIIVLACVWVERSRHQRDRYISRIQQQITHTAQAQAQAQAQAHFWSCVVWLVFLCCCVSLIINGQCKMH
jgi:hypothetical protein